MVWLPPVKIPPPPRDGVRQHRNSVLEEVQNEINKIHYTRTPTVFTYSEICQIIQRLRI